MSGVELWYERHLRLRKNYRWPIRFLLWVGFVKIGRKDASCRLFRDGTTEYIHPETILWPFDAPAWHTFKYLLRAGPRVYRFRNIPGVIDYVPGRLLPLRWGFGILGFEFGSRG